MDYSEYFYPMFTGLINESLNPLSVGQALLRQPAPPVEAKVTGEVDAHIISFACAEPPKEYVKRTLHLLSGGFVKLGYVDSISHTQVARIRK